MGRFYDVIGGLKYSLKKFRDSSLIKWTIIYDLGMIFATMLDFALFFILFSLLFGWTFEEYRSYEANLPFFAVIAGLWLVPRLMLAGMRAAELKTVEKAPGIINWAHLAIRKFLVNTFCWYDKKLLIPAVSLFGLAFVAMGLIIAGIEPLTMQMAAFGFIILSAFAWAIAILVHTIRTNFADYMYLRNEGPLEKIPRRSYDLVHGQTFEVFLAWLVFGLIYLIVLVAVIIGMVVLAFIPCVGIIVDLLLGIVLIIAATAIAQVFMVDMFRFFADGGKKVVAGKESAKTKDPVVKKQNKPAKKMPVKKTGKKRKK